MSERRREQRLHDVYHANRIRIIRLLANKGVPAEQKTMVKRSIADICEIAADILDGMQGGAADPQRRHMAEITHDAWNELLQFAVAVVRQAEVADGKADSRAA